MASTHAKKLNERMQEEEAAENLVKSIAATDYAENMFKDGKHPPSNAKETARGYDAAVHVADSESPALYGEADAAETLLDASPDTTHSRDGTDAAGSADEAGGSLGGTEQELDHMEASHVPVDKTAHMKD